MFRGRAIPIFGVIDCRGVPHCIDAGRPPRTVWLLLYPDCTGPDDGDFGWAIFEAVEDVTAGHEAHTPCGPNG